MKKSQTLDAREIDYLQWYDSLTVIKINNI